MAADPSAGNAAHERESSEALRHGAVRGTRFVLALVAAALLFAFPRPATAAEAEAASHAEAHDPLENPFHHVMDAPAFELPIIGEIHLPKILGLQITKFMVLQLVAFGLALAIFVPLAGRIRNGQPAGGRFWGFWEMILLYLRDEVVRPTIGDPHVHHADFGTPNHVDTGAEPKGQFNPGHADPLKETLDPVSHLQQKIHTHLPAGELGGHPADKYLPIVWSVFFYILFCNLLGAIPGLGSPTGHISVTAMLALFVFCTVLYVGMKASGVAGYFANLMPTLDLPIALKIPISILLYPIELFGLLIKHFVLAVRLFANLMGGHTVLFVILAFIAVAANAWLRPDVNPALGYGMYGMITVASVAGQVFISLLELFVSFLQAYVFAFLTTLFISAAVHPH
jgi:F-type H+-transporting ATPase subunit a